uniref:RING-type domain-containing protein n=1 Tax=Poecilia latipinna TaxID=48699 RepID=A0A3B3TJS0_9TELE
MILMSTCPLKILCGRPGLSGDISTFIVCLYLRPAFSLLTDESFLIVLKGKSKFSCGSCKAAWPFEEVCKMALLTPEEKKNFEKMMKINSAVSRKCPGCKSFVVKQDELNLCVSCTACTEKKGRPYEFCWQCQRKWKGPKPRSDRCENDGCSNTALQTLRTCPEIVFDTVWGISGCPSIRACPTCGSLLEHKRNHCKHLYCARCEVKFCFVCLKTFAECSKTSHISGPCSSGVLLLLDASFAVTHLNAQLLNNKWAVLF